MIRRFRIPVPRPARITATPPPSASMPPALLFIEVEVASRDERRGVTLLRARVPILGQTVETPWTHFADDIAGRPDRLRDVLTHQAWEQCDPWVDAWETEERWS